MSLSYVDIIQCKIISRQRLSFNSKSICKYHDEVVMYSARRAEREK
jgi:hypothetical protein